MTEVRGDEQGFRKLLEEGIPPDQVVLGAVDAIADMMTGLMSAVPKHSVKPATRVQINALATNIVNCRDAIKTDLVDLPPEIQDAMQDVVHALAEALGVDSTEVNEQIKARENARAGGTAKAKKGTTNGDSAKG